MSMRVSRRDDRWTGAAVRGSALVVLTAWLVAGCGVLPQGPPPLPEFVPDAVASESPRTMPVGPDGFTVAERVAMRVWAVNCDSYVNGSAWVLDESTVVTNRHVIEQASEIELSSYDGVRYVAAESFVFDGTDLGIVTIDGTFPEAATIADSAPEVGDELIVSGYPRGNALESDSGNLIEVMTDPLEESERDVYRISVQTQQGNSGSAVVNTAGEVVGVLYAGSDTDQSWAVSLETLREFLDDPQRRLPNVSSCE